MTKNTQKQRIEQAVVSGNLLPQTTANNTHFKKHMDVSDKDSLERTFDDVTANSAFHPDSDPTMLIEDAILYKSAEIARWQAYAKQYETKEFRVRMEPGSSAMMIDGKRV